MRFQICKDKSHWKQLDIFKHRQARCKKEHILPPTGGNFIRLHLLCRLRRDKQVQWSGSGMKRLHKRNEMACRGVMKWRRERFHPPSLCELWRDKQARLPEFGEDVKKTFGFEWSCASRSEVKPCGFVIFFARNSGKKNGVQVTVSAPHPHKRKFKSLLCR